VVHPRHRSPIAGKPLQPESAPDRSICVNRRAELERADRRILSGVAPPSLHIASDGATQVTGGIGRRWGAWLAPIWALLASVSTSWGPFGARAPFGLRDDDVRGRTRERPIWSTCPRHHQRAGRTGHFRFDFVRGRATGGQGAAGSATGRAGVRRELGERRAWAIRVGR